MKIIKWIQHRLNHKLQHMSWVHLKDTFKKHGLVLLAIIIVWEIIEDIGFPILFIWLGNNVHPLFLAGAPASWLLCLHWAVVPVTWGLWVKYFGGKSNE